jgi:hypothetical protein
MRTRLRGKFSLLFLMFGLLLAFPALALADILKNDVANDVGVGQIRVYAAGDPATSIGYYVDATNECDPANGTPATVSLSVSEFNNAALDAAHTGVVTIDPSLPLTFSQCDVKQQVNFSTAANAPRGDYTITADATDSGTGDTYNESPATFKLRVIDNCNGQEPGPGTDNSGSPTDGTCDAPNNGGGGTNQPPTADAGGPYTVDEGSSTNALNGTGSDPENGPLTYAWDLDNDGQYDDSTEMTPRFSAANLDGPSSRTIKVQVTDPEGLTATDEATVDVLNVPPTIQNIATSASQALTSKSVSFTATTRDPSTADTSAGFTYAWLVDGNADPFTANPLSTTFSDCGEHSVSATATDQDGGVSASVTSDVVSVQEAHFRPPLDEGVFNTVQKGRVVPVKISIGCAGQNLSGLQPAIQLLKGDKSDGSETGSDAIETFSSSAADTTGIMRAVDDGYIYNLQVPTNAVANDLYTVRVRPFGDGNPGSSMYVVLKIRK